MPLIVQQLLPSYKVLLLSLLLLFGMQAGLSVMMRFFHRPITFMSLVPFVQVAFSQSTNVSVDLSWHAPLSSSLNNLNSVINGSGIDGFIFNSSTLPPGASYGRRSCKRIQSSMISDMQ